MPDTPCPLCAALPVPPGRSFAQWLRGLGATLQQRCDCGHLAGDHTAQHPHAGPPWGSRTCAGWVAQDTPVTTSTAEEGE
jgi:hypothetical protein